MEKLSHSRNQTSSALSKKICNGNGFGDRSAYDDVFGGPPKFGVPTISPRVEDYTEIFGGFHASRASSIPVLDLPAVEEADVFFDVREVDYSDIFGGFGSLDFAVSYEELLGRSKDGDDSSDEAWTPAETGSLSEESDYSGKNESMAYGDAHQSFDDSKEFNISYQVNQRNKENMPNGPHVTPLDAAPGYTDVADGTALQKTDYESPPQRATGDISFSRSFGGGKIKEKYLWKTMSYPQNGNGATNTFGIEPPVGYGENSSQPSRTFVTVSEISLRTQPSPVPPPLRPPPIADVKKGDSDGPGSQLKATKNYAFEGIAGASSPGSSPPFFDVEVDATSSAAASAAAMKEAMEKAQAKLKSAKELMQKRKEGLQSRTKLASKSDTKHKEGKLGNISNNLKDAKVLGSCETLKTFVKEESQKELKTTQVLPDSLEGEPFLNVTKNSSEGRHGKESWSFQNSYKTEGTGKWKEATEFYELVRGDKSRKEQANNVVLKSKVIEGRQKEKKAAIEPSEQQEDKDKKIYAAHEAHRWEQNDQSSAKEPSEWEVPKGRSKLAKEALRHEEHEKIDVAQVFRGWKENEKTWRVSLEHEETELKLNVADEWEEHDILIEIQKENEVEVKEAMKQENERRLKEATEKAGNKRNLKKFCDIEKSEKKLQVTLEQEEMEKKLIAENEKIQEALKCQENEKNKRETCEREEDARRSKVTVDWEENEKKQKEAHEREENEKKLEPAKLEENVKRSKEALKWEQTLKQQEEACEREEKDKRLKEALEREENEKKQKALEKRLKEAYEREEIEKKQLKDAHEREEIEKRRKDVHRQAEDAKRLNETNERKESEKILEEMPEWEETGRKLQEATKLESEKRLGDSGDVEELKGLKKADYQIHNENEKKPKFCEQMDEKNFKATDEACKQHEKNIHAAQVAQKYEVCSLEANQEAPGCQENRKIAAEPQVIHKDFKAVELENVLVEEIFGASGMGGDDAEREKNKIRVDNSTGSALSDENVKISLEAGIGVDNGQAHLEKHLRAAQLASKPEDLKKNFVPELAEREKSMKQTPVSFEPEDGRDKFRSTQVLKEWVDGKKAEAAQPTALEARGNIQKTTKPVSNRPSTEKNEKNITETLTPEEREREERAKKEKELEKDRLRKLEEEREREREREKDRMAVDRATHEARDRVYAEARERAERAAVEKATAEARQRALTEARERLEKACAEAREKTFSDKTSIDARLRAERAAVERATAEARERAFEKAMAEKAVSEARERMERSVSDKFSASSRNSGMRPSSSASELQDMQSQSTGSSIGSRYPYSSVYGASYNTEKSEGVEGESAQRCKARLERYRRTAERAAKALAEKNKRDLLAQREQAERNRLAETLDADVKRWSSGKEGNLRALLSTLQYILGPDSGWQPIPLTDVITAVAVKKAYRKATLCVHPDKLQQRGASIQQKYICEKVFDLLKEAWNKFNSEER